VVGEEHYTVVDTILLPYYVGCHRVCAGQSFNLDEARGRLPEQWIIPILREVGGSHLLVHKQGIIHRDIKCANVLVH